VLAVVGLCVTAGAGTVVLRTYREAIPERLRSPEPASASTSGPRAPLLVVVFGLIALCTAYGEGALGDWGALHIQQDLHTGPSLAAAGFAAFSLAMSVGRLSGTRLLERLGHTAAVVLGGGTAAAGMLVASLAPQVWLVVLGFAVTGLGLANIFPIAMVRAGALAGPGGVATASTLGYGGMLIGPPAIGFLAEHLGLPVALTTVALLAAFAAAIAYGVRGTPQSADGDGGEHADRGTSGSAAPGGGVAGRGRRAERT
jgi:MFS family permease